MLMGVLLFIFLLNIPPKLNSKNTIRILIDRMPITLENSQSLDNIGKHIWPLVEESHYQVQNFNPIEGFDLVPPSPHKPTLHFQLVKDELSIAFHYLKGDADVIYDVLSIAKTEWLRKKYPSLIYENEGDGLSYLGFNQTRPRLNQLKVRKAIAEALPIQQWTHSKLFDWAVPLQPNPFPHYDPDAANHVLDQAGYPIQEHGMRFSLTYYTTPVREGNETALLVKEALKAIHIEVVITLLETSLYFEKLKKGDYDLFSSKWIRYSQDEPIFDLLESQGKRNYTHFHDPAFDQLLQQNPKLNFNQAIPILTQELPIFPLYTWKHGLILSKRILAPPNLSIALDESFRFLARLELNSSEP